MAVQAREGGAAVTSPARLATIRAAHARDLARRAAAAKREAQGDRFAKTIAPHLRGDDAAYALDRDALDELDRSTVRLRGVA